MAYQNIIVKLNDIKNMVFPNVNAIKEIVIRIESNIDNDASLLDYEEISSLLDAVISSYERKLNESMNSIGGRFGASDPLLLIDSLAQLRSLREYINTKKTVGNYLKKRNIPNSKNIMPQLSNNVNINKLNFKTNFRPNNNRQTFGPIRSRSSSPVRGGKRRQTKRRRNSRR